MQPPLTEFSYRLHITTGHSSFVTSVAFSPDGKTIVSGSHDTTIRLWDVESGKIIECEKCNQFDSVRFTIDGKTLATKYGRSRDWSGNFYSFDLWDVQNGRKIASENGEGGFFDYVTLSPDGKTVVSVFYVESSQTLYFWDVQSGKKNEYFLPYKFVNSVTFSPDGKTFLIKNDDNPYVLDYTFNNIVLWDVQSQKEIACLESNRGGGKFKYEAFSPDSKSILTCKNKTIHILNTQSGKEIACFVGFQDGEWLCFTPDSFYNSSHGASKHFCFLEQSDQGERVLEPTHSIYKERKKQEGLLSSLYR